MSTHYEQARAILIEILSSTRQEPAARLKQKLQKVFERRTGIRFDQRQLRYAKFSDFLRANDDQFEIISPSGSGDISVRLRSSERGLCHAVPVLPGDFSPMGV